MITFFNDVPMTKDEDLFFGYKEMAAKYADAFLSRSLSPPFALLIDGERGAGKTTMMYAIDRHIKRQTERYYHCESACADGESSIRLCRTFWFHPTKYQNEDKIIAIFLYNLLCETKEHPYVKAMLKRKECRRALQSLKVKLDIYVPPWFHFSISNKKDANRDSSNVMYPEIDLFLKEAHDLIDPYLKCGGSDCTNKQINSNTAFVVFIDDLDMCDEAKLPRLVSRINTLIDMLKERCFFIFGISTTQYDRIMARQVPPIDYDYGFKKMFQGIYPLPTKAPDEFMKWARKFFKPALDAGTLTSGMLEKIVNTCDTNCREAKKTVNRDIIKATRR